MASFDDLKKQAEVQVQADKAATVSWFRAHLRSIVVTLVGLVVGFILGRIY